MACDVQVKIWFQNRRSKVKKLVRHSDIQLTAAGSDEMKSDQLSNCSADADAEVDADDDDDDHSVIGNKHSEEYHVNAGSSSPSQSQQQQQLIHRASSWDDVPPSFQRLPALTQLNHNYPVSSSDDPRLSAAVDCATKSNWTDSYSSCVNRLQAPCPGDSSVSDSQMAAAARQFGYQSLFHGAAHQWYATQTSPQTLLI